MRIVKKSIVAELLRLSCQALEDNNPIEKVYLTSDEWNKLKAEVGKIEGGRFYSYVSDPQKREMKIFGIDLYPEEFSLTVTCNP